MRSFLNSHHPERNHASKVLNVRSCGELFFPETGRSALNVLLRKWRRYLSVREEKYIATLIVHHATPGYTGPLPYAVGAVELPGGIVILSPLTQCQLDQLKIGMNVELVLEKLYEDENGNEVISYKFRPC